MGNSFFDDINSGKFGAAGNSNGSGTAGLGKLPGIVGAILGVNLADANGLQDTQVFGKNPMPGLGRLFDGKPTWLQALANSIGEGFRNGNNSNEIKPPTTWGDRISQGGGSGGISV
jgi:hypothetical protein